MNRSKTIPECGRQTRDRTHGRPTRGVRTARRIERLAARTADDRAKATLVALADQARETAAKSHGGRCKIRRLEREALVTADKAREQWRASDSTF